MSSKEYHKEYAKKNKEKLKLKRAKYYEENKEKSKVSSRISYSKRIKEYRDWLKERGCCVCSCRVTNCLQVHHLDPKYKRRANSAFENKRDVLNEHAVVLCANCHFLFHMAFGGLNKSFPIQTKESCISIILKEWGNDLAKFCEINA